MLSIMFAVAFLSYSIIHTYHQQIKQSNFESVAEISYIMLNIMLIEEAGKASQASQSSQHFQVLLSHLEKSSKTYRISEQPLTPYHIKFTIDKKKHTGVYEYAKVEQLVKKIANKDWLPAFSLYLPAYGKWLNMHFLPTIFDKMVVAVFIFAILLMLIVLYFIVIYLRFSRLWHKLLQSSEYYTGAKEKPLDTGGLKYHIRILFSSDKILQSLIRRLKDITSQKHFIMTALMHNIRTPITRAKLLLDMPKALDDSKIRLQNELDQINNQITKIAKYYKSTSHLDPAVELDIVEILHERCQKIPSQGFTINNKVQGKLYVKTQKLAMELAVDNIIDNAIKYAKQLTIDAKKHKEGVNLFFSSQRKLSDQSDMEGQGSGLGIKISEVLLRQNDCALSTKNFQKNYIVVVTIPREIVIEPYKTFWHGSNPVYT